MASLAVEAVGTAAAICSMTSFTPQLLKIWRARDASSVSLRMYAITVTGFSLWVAYGVLLESWPIIGANSVCLALSAGILFLKWRFERWPSGGVAGGPCAPAGGERGGEVARQDPA